MSKFQVGQKVRVVGDTFQQDPHGLKIGSVLTVESISPATPYEEFPHHVQLMFMVNGWSEFDLPERIHVRFGHRSSDYANIVFEDVEPVAEGKVRMLEDDMSDGYSRGDIFDIVIEDGEQHFRDNDGDLRPLHAHEHEVI